MHTNPTPRPPSTLTASRLVKRYGDTVALDDVDVQLRAGQSLALTGPSGSGKSTLLYCMAGILLPDSGSVDLDGTEVTQLREAQRTELRRSRFGFVFQFSGLLPELTAEENVALPLMLGGWSRRRAVELSRSWFAPLELDGLEQRRPGQLSGGQAQRVAIARALVTKPAVVFADEPTGALDSRTSERVMHHLVGATAHHDTALVVVTHDDAVADACQQRMELRDGRISTVGQRTAATAEVR